MHQNSSKTCIKITAELFSALGEILNVSSGSVAVHWRNTQVASSVSASGLDSADALGEEVESAAAATDMEYL